MWGNDRKNPYMFFTDFSLASLLSCSLDQWRSCHRTHGDRLCAGVLAFSAWVCSALWSAAGISFLTLSCCLMFTMSKLQQFKSLALVTPQTITGIWEFQVLEKLRNLKHSESSPVDLGVSGPDFLVSTMLWQFLTVSLSKLLSLAVLLFTRFCI